ncbi:hypothetical protein E3N88_28072 [Mikania micrantha]|uniref:DDE Tnp4 domain-containing protein n=1 Tax=Mikania micrantha TaxID=192012 RepID=A0A5N6MZ31_9ASTR|nr:hypothetical protein E3N88_28072 [Mikania micrantha]
MEFLRKDDDFSEGEEFLIEAAQLTLDIIRQQVERHVLTRRARINRDRLGAHERLVEDYFSENPKYPEHLFRRRFRMSRNIFSRVSNDSEQKYDFFQQRCDGRGKIGFSGLQKCTSAIRQLAYGTSSDSFVKSFTSRQTDDEKRLYFQNRQEGARKDIERAFGVLKKKWHMIIEDNALYACVILHNMIIEDNGRAICEFYEEVDPNLLEHVEINEEEKQANRRMLRNKDTHANLKADLIEHLWKNRFY